MAKSFVYCPKCNKKLMERLPNGLWRFVFGGSTVYNSPVDITIAGSVRIKCTRRSCKTVTIFNYFPRNFGEETK